MTFLELFRETLERLQQEQVRFALAGGLAASLFRKRKRTTDDLGFLILAAGGTQQVAEKIILSFGYTPHIARKADLEGGPMFAIKRKSTPPYIIVGKKKDDSSEPGLDFILPAMPWSPSALDRAESNRIDFGFGTIPTITVEDMILAKFYSLYNDVKRLDDQSDLRSIFKMNHDLDLAYIAGQMNVLRIRVPVSVTDVAPSELKKVSKRIRCSS